MRDIGIVNEAIIQTTALLQEVRNSDYNDSISYTLMLYGHMAGLYTALNEAAISPTNLGEVPFYGKEF